MRPPDNAPAGPLQPGPASIILIGNPSDRWPRNRMDFDYPMILAVTLPWGLALLVRGGKRIVAGGSAPPIRWKPIRNGLALAVALWAGFALYAFREDLRFLWIGEPADGEVLRSHRGPGKAATPVVSFAFTDAAGQSHHLTQHVSKAISEGEAVHVRYLADDPATARLIGRWDQRTISMELLFPMVLTAWFGWMSLIACAAGSWAALAAAYPDVGAGANRRRWRFQSGRVGDGSIGNSLFLAAGSNGLRVSILFAFRPGLPPFVIPWSDLRVEYPGDGPAVLTATRVPNARILVLSELGKAIEAHAGPLWPQRTPEADDPA